MKSIVVFVFIFCFSVGTLFAQQINQKDVRGMRQGLWKKYYPNSQQLRYTGSFVDDKEVGTFTFYCETCGEQPFCVKEFSPNAPTQVRYYTKSGDLVSKGAMSGKQRNGLWLIFHENSQKVMTREFYVAGKLHGEITSYYLSGEIIETTTYLNGVKQGKSSYYASDGVKLKELSYKNDLLDGPAAYYSHTGKLTMKGDYKNGIHHGVWNYYKDGIFILSETFPKPENKN
jgi:antitoxin component YwqK of YwqJK toxin-antitoxin module